MDRKSEYHRGDLQALEHVEYPCPVCKDRMYETEQGFTDHLRNDHQIFSCSKCEKIFAAADELLRHKVEAGHTVPPKTKRKAKSRSPVKSCERARQLPKSPMHLSTQETTASKGNDTDRRAQETPATPSTVATTSSHFIPRQQLTRPSR
ncbi:uncharacterized protein N7525_008654 [Penicillium rubens]|uniref:uncharacterized protein n=1 Tax=Penicillium rubens TaxID=1108849 RepID=UPI002A5A6E13|nr:uncharacterized protein N7525_008654 [Penicillium rubens]KAJ5830401.1 hypothetical protein N7525_008654 [Penicillium rubens]KAJ5853983.1 hypothetical protein N7534_006526 [Penicillium rubens]